MVSVFPQTGGTVAQQSRLQESSARTSFLVSEAFNWFD